MLIFKREMLRNMTSTVVTIDPDDACGEMPTESPLQDLLFSDVMMSVCYWATVLLLGIVGASLLYWRLKHPGLSSEPISDPFGVTTPPWMIVSLPPIGVTASLGHAAWCAAPRTTCLENVGYGCLPYRRHVRDDGARSTSGAALTRIQSRPDNPEPFMRYICDPSL